MQTIRVGLGRLYNASACSNLGRDEILLLFPLGSIEVRRTSGLIRSTLLEHGL